MNRQFEFTVELTQDGYSAYCNYKAPDGVVSAFGITGDTFDELKANILDAVNLVLEDERRTVTMDDIVLRPDLAQFFKFYPELNASGLAKRAGINNSLLAQYVSGNKKPSNKQVDKVLQAIRSLGREMANLDLAF